MVMVLKPHDICIVFIHTSKSFPKVAETTKWKMKCLVLLIRLMS